MEPSAKTPPGKPYNSAGFDEICVDAALAARHAPTRSVGAYTIACKLKLAGYYLSISYGYRENIMVGKCTEGQYKGELCRRRRTQSPRTARYRQDESATARSSQQGGLDTLKRNSLCTYMKKIGAESDVCNTIVKSASRYGVKL